MGMRRSAEFAALAVLLVACRAGARREAEPRDVALSASASHSAALETTTVGPTSSGEPEARAAVPSAQPSAASPSTEGKTTEPTSRSCADDMVLVEGLFCPAVVQNCLEHTKEYDRDVERRAERKSRGESLPMSRVSERCLRYANPSRCVSKERRPMRFCIDRYEWPNRALERPSFAVTWLEAKEKCEASGKRLCDEDEFTFACEGEAMSPYVYGFERDASRCNIDRPYVFPTRKATPYEACIADSACKAELDALDQRTPSGSLAGCVSPFGAMDLNGNVNEWVNRPGQAAPWRSGLKGGWWGPARSRCRPTVTAHNEIYAGYEVGFRCCSATKP